MNIDITKFYPGTGKVVTYSLLLVMIVVVYFVVRNAIKKAKADAEALKLKSEIKQNDLSYPLNQYVEMADSLEYAMNGAGTDNKTVTATFDKIRTLSDILQLISAFGIREYSSGWTAGIFTDNYNLTQYIQGDLNRSEIETLNRSFSSKGINFSF